MSYVREANACNYTPKPLITFPVYLVEGDNGNTGKNLYKYLVDKYEPGNNLELSEEIYFENKKANTVNTNDRKW